MDTKLIMLVVLAEGSAFVIGKHRCYLIHLYVVFFCVYSLSGLSPFMGDDNSETLSNVTAAEWDFDDESFDVISDEAKDFISQLLRKNPG